MAASDLSRADFAKGEGEARFAVDLTLDYVRGRCICGYRPEIVLRQRALSGSTTGRKPNGCADSSLFTPTKRRSRPERGNRTIRKDSRWEPAGRPARSL